MKSIIKKIWRTFLRLLGLIMIVDFVNIDNTVTQVDSDEVYLIRSDQYNIGIFLKCGTFYSFPIDKEPNLDNYKKISEVVTDIFLKTRNNPLEN